MKTVLTDDQTSTVCADRYVSERIKIKEKSYTRKFSAWIATGLGYENK